MVGHRGRSGNLCNDCELMIIMNICIALLLLAVGGGVVYGAMYGIIQGMKETIDSLYSPIIELKSELNNERKEYNPMKNN